MLCHNCLEHLVMHDRQVVTAKVVRRVIDEDVKPSTDRRRSWPGLLFRRGGAGRVRDAAAAIREGTAAFGSVTP